MTITHDATTAAATREEKLAEVLSEMENYRALQIAQEAVLDRIERILHMEAGVDA